MRRLRELLAVMGALAVALAAMLLWAPSAIAGGPTSVLVVSPESAETTALYYSDQEYGQLMRLLGEPGSGTREEPPGLGAAGGHQLNVTWLVHDVSPWRVDRVYPDSPRSKDVWIHTTTDLPSMNGYWHRAEHPAQVRALFKKLGVLGKPSPEGGGEIFPAPWQTPEDSNTAPAPAPTEQARTTTAAGATADDGTDWWWAIPGAAAGAVLALVLRPLVAGVPGARPLGRRERETEPRQELRDV
ncbi:hypothetical protein [Streptomyces sp. NPDC050564]|uniref:hypothetical protein n=1 Tax=Streptomyces sp. NPDC050564 TaxID=3365631 RepID=UPI0037A76656